jgi:hypothetical protein
MVHLFNGNILRLSSIIGIGNVQLTQANMGRLRHLGNNISILIRIHRHKMNTDFMFRLVNKLSYVESFCLFIMLNMWLAEASKPEDLALLPQIIYDCYNLVRVLCIICTEESYTWIEIVNSPKCAKCIASPRK